MKTYYKMTSVSKSYTFQNLLKNITLLPAEKVGNINLYQQTFICIFSYNKYNLVRLWVKVFVSQGRVQSEITLQTL